MKQLTEQEAIDLYESKGWKDWPKEDIARFQLFQNKLCMPFGVFHEAIEDLLDRPVWTHEFADMERDNNGQSTGID